MTQKWNYLRMRTLVKFPSQADEPLTIRLSFWGETATSRDAGWDLRVPRLRKKN